MIPERLVVTQLSVLCSFQKMATSLFFLRIAHHVSTSLASRLDTKWLQLQTLAPPPPLYIRVAQWACFLHTGCLFIWEATLLARWAAQSYLAKNKTSLSALKTPIRSRENVTGILREIKEEEEKKSVAHFIQVGTFNL